MGGITEYGYDAANRMTTIKDAPSIVYNTNQYDTNGRVIQQTHADSGIYQFAYTVDANNKVTQCDVTDPRGNIRRVTFNADRYSLTDTHALGKPEQDSLTYERQATSNFISSKIDPLGRRTSYAYDANGNLTSMTSLSGTADAVTTTYTYEPNFNQVASITNPLNHTTSFDYDGKGNLTRVTDPLNHQVNYIYNSAG